MFLEVVRMSIKMRIEVERKIVTAIVKDALKAGYRLTPSLERGYDREAGDPLLGSTDVKAVLAELTAGDDAHLFIHAADGPVIDGSTLVSVGWVYFVFGNDGWDVVSDYTTNLDKLGLMTRADKIAKRYES